MTMSKEVKHEERQHAMLSPSSAHRWLQCTNAPRFEEQFPDSESEAAREGTMAHELCEKVLNGIEIGDDVDPTMLRHAKRYAEYIYAIEANYKEPSRFVETRLSLDKYVPHSFGTTDCIIISDNDLHVVDFKYGMGVMVSVLDNPQMMIYALGALEEYGWLYDNIQTVHMHIYQPRMANICETSMTVDRLRAWGEMVLKPLAKRAYNGDGVWDVGEWCRFCRGGGACKARLEKEMDAFKEVDDNFDDNFSNNIADGKLLAKWLDAGARITDLMKSVQDHALAMAMADRGSIPGYKVVQKRTMRRWRDEEGLMKRLRLLGYKEDTYLNKKLRGIGELERRLEGSGVNLNAFIYKPDGAPELVVATDKREEMITDEQIFS